MNAATKVHLTKSQAKFFNCNFVSHAACMWDILWWDNAWTFFTKKLTKWHLRILKLVKVELKIELSPFLFNFLIQNAIWLRLQPRLDYEFAPQYKKDIETFIKIS